MNNVLFQFEAVRVLTLGHYNDSFSETWKGLVIAFQGFWWGKGPRERSCRLDAQHLSPLNWHCLAITVLAAHGVLAYFTAWMESNSSIASFISSPTRRQSANMAFASACCPFALTL